MELSVLVARQSAHVSYLSGFALNNEGREQAAMGIAVGGYNRDEKVDFCITNFSDDYPTLNRNDGGASFTDVSYAAGIANATTPFLGWGTGFLDYDSDGFLDLFFANGHVYPEVDKQDRGTTWAQRPVLFRNLNRSKFEPVAAAAGSLTLCRTKRLTSLESVRKRTRRKLF